MSCATPLTNSTPVTINPPHECKKAGLCGEDISLEAAVKSFMSLPFPVSELEPMVDKHVCDSATALKYYHWAPAEKLPNGRQITKHLTGLAETRAIQSGFTVVRLGKQPPAESHLALCRAVQVAGMVSSPRACVTVAILSSSGTWLRASRRTSEKLKPVCPALATNPLSDGSALIQLNITTSLVDPRVLSTQILTTFSERLNLRGEERVEYDYSVNRERITITMINDQTNPKATYQGISFPIELTLNISPSTGSILLHGFAAIWLEQKTSGSEIVQFELTKPQAENWSSTINSALESAVSRVCRNFKKENQDAAYCD